MSARDLIEALLPHDLSKPVVFEVDITGHFTREVAVTGIAAKNHTADERRDHPRLVITGGELLVVVKTEVKLEVEP